MKCDAIVIGGGVVGLSAALCLLEAGLKQVLILERQVLASGGTGLGTGSVHTQRWFATDSDLVLRSKHIISQISERSGGVFQLFSVGRLTVVGEADAQIVVDYGRHLRDCGIEAVELSPEALLKRYPGMNVSDVGAALFTPEDGVVYPPAMIWALAGAIRRAGGNIWEGCGASRIVIENGATRGVQLLNGDVLECGRVVVAAGVWSRRVLAGGAIVLLFTDGLERHLDDSLAFEMDRLHRSCRRLIWLNPLLRFDGFEARARGVRAMLPHVDEFRSVHNLISLSDLAQALSGTRSRDADPRRFLER